MLAGEAAVAGNVKKLPMNLAVSAPVCKIATFHPNGLAALVATFPALVALRESFPGARISSFAPEAVLPLLEHFGAVDEAHGRPAGGLPSQAAIMAKLRVADFDIGLSFSPSSNALLLLWATGAGIRAGFVPSRLDAFLTHRVEREGPLTDLAAMELVRSVGASPRGTCARELLDIPPAALRTVDKLMEAYRIEGAFMIFAPATGRRGQSSAERESQNAAWISAMQALSARGSVVIAGPKSLGLDRIAAKLPVPCVDLSGKLDALALAALCARAGSACGDEPGTLALCDFLEKSTVKGTPPELARLANSVLGL
jgi:ADP-heptose:LPS heptosyltransferase